MVTIANAGHLSPYLDGKEMELPGALPLGIADSGKFETRQFELRPGSRLTFYSDGVVEAQNKSGELFGFERAKAISTQSAAAIVAAAVKFGQEDDITVVTIERLAATKCRYRRSRYRVRYSGSHLQMRRDSEWSPFTVPAYFASGGRGMHMLLHLLLGDVADVGGEIPHVAKRILETGCAVAIELVSDRPLHRCACCGGLFGGCINIWHVDEEGDGRALEVIRAVSVNLGGFVCQHDS